MREILLVEDSDHDARALADQLQFAGVANPVRHISSGTDALIHLLSLEHQDSSQIPAVLFLDLSLPGVDGYEILQQIKSLPVFSTTLKIVFSQFEDLPAIRKAYLLGAHSFLPKPVKQEDLSELFAAFRDHWSFSEASSCG